ncbi:DUF5990 family protein [Nannocystis sp. SCPEA4]|uniref:DUF5990 family protein n=1 Tax=Nannocystis sp. SCPEA4 TaxID=2996787 RepID=UPI00226E2C61|nr:DUF5990 family protein [Nannocystis sp. SCPEA4]MCY1054963.1 DUF5990 family protein [Nannocystis sp. SCPEA4]
MQIRIVGTDLPGRRFCAPEGGTYDNVHVGLQRGKEPVQLVAGDAASAEFVADVALVRVGDAIDARGPFVHGPGGERFLYLTWGAVGDDGGFAMFRRAKLCFADIDPGLLAEAADRGVDLTATISLTDARGGPRCARVRPPAIAWRAG